MVKYSINNCSCHLFIIEYIHPSWKFYVGVDNHALFSYRSDITSNRSCAPILSNGTYLHSSQINSSALFSFFRKLDNVPTLFSSASLFTSADVLKNLTHNPSCRLLRLMLWKDESYGPYIPIHDYIRLVFHNSHSFRYSGVISPGRLPHQTWNSQCLDSIKTRFPQ